MADWASGTRALMRLTAVRTANRLRLAARRVISPRRLLSSLLMIGFLVGYLLCGIFVLSNRQPADPERLRLWLSGGMVVYCIYHATRCVWSRPGSASRLTPAESLWLVGAPLRANVLSAFEFFRLVPAAVLKTGLLVIVLFTDVPQPWLLTTAVFISLMMLETTRLIGERFGEVVNDRIRRNARIAVTAIAVAAVFRWLTRLLELTPLGSDELTYVHHAFLALGDLAAEPVIQWLALPWQPASRLSTVSELSVQSCCLWLSSVAALPLMMAALSHCDAWASRHQLRDERERWKSDLRRPKKPPANALFPFDFRISRRALSTLAEIFRFNRVPIGPRVAGRCPDGLTERNLATCLAHGSPKEPDASAFRLISANPSFQLEQSTSVFARFDAFRRDHFVLGMSDEFLRPCFAVMARQAIAFKKYWGQVLFSFLIPVLLCLSPMVEGIVTSDQQHARRMWWMVVGGIVMCTMMLAPHALRMDFRRDLSRMVLLRSLAVTPSAMVFGQLTLPILVIMVFQFLVVGIAATMLGIGWYWPLTTLACTSALAVAVMASENATFLAFPHHERAQGIAMIVRAKLVFLAKSLLASLVVIGLMVMWALCGRLLGHGWAPGVFALAASLVCWSIAVMTMAATVWTWKRFDLAYDIPPQ